MSLIVQPAKTLMHFFSDNLFALCLEKQLNPFPMYIPATAFHKSTSYPKLDKQKCCIMDS